MAARPDSAPPAEPVSQARGDLRHQLRCAKATTRSRGARSHPCVPALRGDPVNADGDVLNPPPPALAGSVWESPASLERTGEIARRGSGLLLSRIAIGG